MVYVATADAPQFVAICFTVTVVVDPTVWVTVMTLPEPPTVVVEIADTVRVATPGVGVIVVEEVAVDVIVVRGMGG